MSRALIAAIVVLTGCAGTAHTVENDAWVETHLRSASGVVDTLLDDSEKHRVQILVSEVIEGPKPRLKRHGYRLSDEYFYPASAIKIVPAVAALEVLNDLRRRRDDGAPTPDTPLRFHPLFDDESLDTTDPSNVDGGHITVAHEVRKLFLVSDNRAHNRLFELVGHREVNERMWHAGLTSVRCIHRLSEFRSFHDNHRSPRVDLVVDGEALTLPERTSDLDIDSSHCARRSLGERHVRGGKTIDQPMDFTRKNSVSIQDLQDCLIILTRPDIDIGKGPFDLDASQVELLREAMSQSPRRSRNPVYDPAKYTDDWVKFLLPGIARVIPKERVRIYNKVGRAYGFSVENAYVVDEGSSRSFYVTAVIYTNANATLNDGVYEYSDVADPFFADLGEVLARRLLR